MSNSKVVKSIELYLQSCGLLTAEEEKHLEEMNLIDEESYYRENYYYYYERHYSQCEEDEKYIELERQDTSFYSSLKAGQKKGGSKNKVNNEISGKEWAQIIEEAYLLEDSSFDGFKDLAKIIDSTRDDWLALLSTVNDEEMSLALNKMANSWKPTACSLWEALIWCLPQEYEGRNSQEHLLTPPAYAAWIHIQLGLDWEQNHNHRWLLKLPAIKQIWSLFHLQLRIKKLLAVLMHQYPIAYGCWIDRHPHHLGSVAMMFVYDTNQTKRRVAVNQYSSSIAKFQHKIQFKESLLLALQMSPLKMLKWLIVHKDLVQDDSNIAFLYQLTPPHYWS